MLEWRPMAVSRFLIEVMVGSHGVLVSYMPNWTVQGATAAMAGCEIPPVATADSDSHIAATAEAARCRKPTFLISPPTPRPAPPADGGRPVYANNPPNVSGAEHQRPRRTAG